MNPVNEYLGPFIRWGRCSKCSVGVLPAGAPPARGAWHTPRCSPSLPPSFPMQARAAAPGGCRICRRCVRWRRRGQAPVQPPPGRVGAPHWLGSHVRCDRVAGPQEGACSLHLGDGMLRCMVPSARTPLASPSGRRWARRPSPSPCLQRLGERVTRSALHQLLLLLARAPPRPAPPRWSPTHPTSHVLPSLACSLPRPAAGVCDTLYHRPWAMD